MTAQRNAAVQSVDPDTSSLQCSEQVCGQVFDTDLHITKVYASTEGTGDDGCISAHYLIVKATDYENVTVLRRVTGAPQVCGGPRPGSYYYNFDNNVPDKMPYTCPSTSTLGVFWDRIAGDPTFKIYKKS